MHGYGLIPPVGKFSRGRSLRLIFPKGGVAHNHDQRVGYSAYTAAIQLQPAAPRNAPSNVLITFRLLCKLSPTACITLSESLPLKTSTTAV